MKILLGGSGYGEAGTGLVERVLGKTGVPGGCKFAMLFDAIRNNPVYYIDRHKIW